jgi:hypothetical protein
VGPFIFFERFFGEVILVSTVETVFPASLIVSCSVGWMGRSLPKEVSLLASHLLKSFSAMVPKQMRDEIEVD